MLARSVEDLNLMCCGAWRIVGFFLFFSSECNSLNSVVSEAFIRFFLETIGHYSLFLTQDERGERVFQRESFRKSVASKSIRRFLGVFMESQMFAGFIQDRELRKSRAKGERDCGKGRESEARTSNRTCLFEEILTTHTHILLIWEGKVVVMWQAVPV